MSRFLIPKGENMFGSSDKCPKHNVPYNSGFMGSKTCPKCEKEENDRGWLSSGKCKKNSSHKLDAQGNCQACIAEKEKGKGMFRW
jgi:hypothetical protein